MSTRDETPAETQYRLHNERECRRIADLIKAELPEGRGFVLVTADHGKGHLHEQFQNTAYVSNLHREDSARLLTELVEHWRPLGIVCEPTAETANALREFVHEIRGNAWERLLHGARCSLRDAESAHRMKDSRRAIVQCLKLAAEALALVDRLHRPEGESS